MATREISRNQWVEFFNDFSKQHQGWLSTLEIIRDNVGDQEEASRLPLVGISADTPAIVAIRLATVIITDKRAWEIGRSLDFALFMVLQMIFEIRVED